MPDGEFLKRLKTVRPDMPTVAIVESNNPQQEIEARVLGVSAVIPEDCDGEYFRQVMASVFGLPDVRAIETLYKISSVYRMSLRYTYPKRWAWRLTQVSGP
jgi:DNA-binding NarL/FixJ family response regulator